ncbi:hypothetical protein D3C80_1812160 [compost metagenome]
MVEDLFGELTDRNFITSLSQERRFVNVDQVLSFTTQGNRSFSGVQTNHFAFLSVVAVFSKEQSVHSFSSPSRFDASHVRLDAELRPVLEVVQRVGLREFQISRQLFQRTEAHGDQFFFETHDFHVHR